MKLAVRADLVALDGYHSPQVSVDVRLNTNESPFPPPEEWRSAFLEELAQVAFNRYPDRGATALRAALAEHHGVEPTQVLAAKGSNEIIQALCLAYGGSGRRAAVFEPTYALHSHIARLTGTEVVTGTRGPDFGLDTAEVEAVLARTAPAITFLCSPNNPTGGIDQPEVVERVASAAPGLVIVDEAYGQFAPWSALSLVNVEASQSSQPLVAVTRTYSKTWSMAASRLGYLVAPAEVVTAAEAVLLPYHLDTATQIAGRLALRFEAQMVERVLAIVAERERLAAALGGMAVDLWPSDANFILLRPRHRPGREVWTDLVERSVLVRDCSDWPRLSNCLRVTVGTPDENDAFLAALAEVLS